MDLSLGNEEMHESPEFLSHELENPSFLMNRTAYEQQKVQVISIREHTHKMDRLQKELSNMIR